MKGPAAVILAGGKGTRLGEICRDIPKPMVALGGRPLLEHQVRLCEAAGFGEVYIMTGHLGDVIERYVTGTRRFGLDIHIRREEELLGTAGCLSALPGRLKAPFLLLYGDIMLDMDLQRLMLFHHEKKGAATLAVHPNNHPFDSDLVDMDASGRIQGFLPKGAPRPQFYRNVVSAAVCVLDPSVLSHIPPDRPSDCVTDLFPALLKKGLPLYGYNTAEYIKDMGTPERLEQVSGDVLAGRLPARRRDASRPALFLDRDGTLVRYHPLACSVDQIALLPSAAPALREINASHFLAFLATNQPVVARNLCGLEDVDRMHAKIETGLGREGAYLDAVYFCPHHPDRGYPEENPAFKIPCTCRKPATGMIERAAKDYAIDLRRSWIIGDTTVDIQTGKNAGLRTALVRTGLAGSDKTYAVRPDLVCDDILEAVRAILGHRKDRVDPGGPVRPRAAADPVAWEGGCGL